MEWSARSSHQRHSSRDQSARVPGEKAGAKAGACGRWALSTLHLSELTLADGQSDRVQAFLSGGMVQREKWRAQVMQ